MRYDVKTQRNTDDVSKVDNCASLVPFLEPTNLSR